jgi:hypothetical protein
MHGEFDENVSLGKVVELTLLALVIGALICSQGP